MRAKATSTVLGYKIVTAMKGLASYLGATSYVNPSKLVQGTMDYAAHPKVWGETIKRLDPKTYNKGFNIALDYIMSTSGTKSMRSVSMILCATADNITSRSV